MSNKSSRARALHTSAAMSVLRVAVKWLATFVLLTVATGLGSCGSGSSVPSLNPSYTISGVVTGLLAGQSVGLQDNGGNTTTVSANGPFTFGAALANQSPYAVTVATQPVGQNCSVTNGSGTVAANVTNVAIACAAASYTIGGTVSGLPAGNSVVLEDNGGNATSISANGAFTFSASLVYQSSYSVTVATQPAGGNCTVSNGSGSVPAANVANVAIVCTTSAVNTGLWTWESGSNMPEFLGVYGTLGAAAPGNVPGGREAAFSWTDSAGNLWLFGGIGAGNSGVGGSFNDLWRYSPSTGLWAWMSGADTLDALSVYGTKGTAAAGNVPSAREGGAAWTDSAGNFWMFGGGGFDSAGSNGALNDLWRYSPSSGLWTWMSGATTGNLSGVYGTQGTPAPGNVPGSRSAIVSWKDSAGNFWMFGGRGHDSNGTIGVLNDLWQYSPTTGHWTWMSGSKLQGAAGQYGTLGIAASGNVPGARQDAVSWIDNAGNLWLFGYGAFDPSGNFVSDGNDLWRYSPSTRLWTWMGGSTTQGATGVYGTEGLAAPGNVPAARDIGLPWTDNAGNFWLFGGYVPSSALNDLWKYVPPGP